MARWAPRGREREGMASPLTGWRSLTQATLAIGAKNAVALLSVDALHHGDAAQKAPLEQEEEDDDGQRRQHRRRHQKVLRGAAHLALERLQTDGQSEHRLVGEVEKRAQKIVPRVDELEQRDDGKRRPGEGNVDLAE